MKTFPVFNSASQVEPPSLSRELERLRYRYTIFSILSVAIGLLFWHYYGFLFGALLVVTNQVIFSAILAVRLARAFKIFNFLS